MGVPPGLLKNSVLHTSPAGPKARPINVTAEDHVTPWSVPVTWEPIEDPETVKKLLGYRVTFQAVLAGDEEVLGPSVYYTVRKDTFYTVIQRLESYTRYKVSISSFSRHANGPASVTLGGKFRFI